MLSKIMKNWLERHQKPINFRLHMVGIPMTVVGVGFWIAGQFWIGLALFVVGYLLQWIGHLLEGNDVGEVIPIKKLLGMPYIAVAPGASSTTQRMPTNSTSDRPAATP